MSSLQFRLVTAHDRSFLAKVYASTRWKEVAATPWSEEEKRVFLQQQFEFQAADWDRNYPEAQRQVVLVDGQCAGRLYVDRRETERDMRVVDIALLPEFRNRGIGSRIFTDLCAEADRHQWSVSIHVERDNPAKRLYERFHFDPVKDTGIYILMRRSPH